jgi:hypothetical protein
MATVAFTAVPKVIELLRSADPGGEMYVRVLNSHRLALGTDPLKPTSIIDLSNEKVLPFSAPDFAVQMDLPKAPAQTFSAAGSPQYRTARATGSYWFELHKKVTECRSLRELLINALRSIEEQHPGTLDRLSRIKPRTRRIVARDRAELFDKPHLVDGYSDTLVEGWWVGTNNSRLETDAWLKRAASCAGLAWGQDFKTSLSSAPDIDDL